MDLHHQHNAATAHSSRTFPFPELLPSLPFLPSLSLSCLLPPFPSSLPFLSFFCVLPPVPSFLRCFPSFPFLPPCSLPPPLLRTLRLSALACVPRRRRHSTPGVSRRPLSRQRSPFLTPFPFLLTLSLSSLPLFPSLSYKSSLQRFWECEIQGERAGSRERDEDPGRGMKIQGEGGKDKNRCS